MAFELVSFADLKKLLDLEASVITDEPGLEIIKPSVEDAIEEHIDVLLESTERTESKNIGLINTRMIKLNALPVASVSSVIVTDSDGNTQTLSATDYRITPYGLRLDTSYYDVDVSVTYIGGYAEGAVPATITRAALLQTAYEFQNKDNIGASSVNTEGGSVQVPELTLLEQVKKELQSFIHPMKGAV